MDVGSQNPDFGSRYPDVGPRNSDFGCQNPDFGCRNPDFGLRIRILDLGIQMLGQNPDFGEPATGVQALDTQIEVYSREGGRDETAAVEARGKRLELIHEMAER